MNVGDYVRYNDDIYKVNEVYSFHLDLIGVDHYVDNNDVEIIPSYEELYEFWIKNRKEEADGGK